MLGIAGLPRDKALQDAIKQVGGTRALARLLRIAPQAIVQWERVPAVRVLEIERLAGVPRHRLRPDIYPPPEEVGNLEAPSTLPLPLLFREAIPPELRLEERLSSTVDMKPAALRRVVEKATDRALRQFAEAHPDLVAEQWRKNVQKRLVAMMMDEMMRAMGGADTAE
jgi:DNA-binding transcriptional regulator YdaS (Cro superfamily)